METGTYPSTDKNIIQLIPEEHSDTPKVESRKKSAIFTRKEMEIENSAFGSKKQICWKVLFQGCIILPEQGPWSSLEWGCVGLGW